MLAQHQSPSSLHFTAAAMCQVDLYENPELLGSPSLLLPLTGETAQAKLPQGQALGTCLGGTSLDACDAYSFGPLHASAGQ